MTTVTAKITAPNYDAMLSALCCAVYYASRVVSATETSADVIWICETDNAGEAYDQSCDCVNIALLESFGCTIEMGVEE